MSNRAFLTWTMFTDEEGDSTWGWLISDDVCRGYHDSFDESEIPTDPMELLTKACTEAIGDEQVLFEHLLEMSQGLYINGGWRDFEEIASALREGLEQEV